MHKRIPVLLLAVIADGASVGSQSPPITSNGEAASILEASLAALGGDKVRKMSALQFVERTTSALYDQSPSPDGPYPPQQLEERLVIDPFGERIHRHEKGTFEQTFFIDGNDAFVLNPATRMASPLVAGPTLDGYRRVTRRVPAFLLLEANQRAGEAQLLPPAMYEKRSHQVVQVPFVDGLVLRLWIDAASRLLSKHERGYVDATLGNTTEETIFLDYRASGAFRMPASYRVRRNAFVVRESQISDVQVNPVMSVTPFRLPAGVHLRPLEPPRPLHAMTKLAERIHVLEQVAGQNANVMVVAQDDGIVVVDAPETRAHSGLGERAIATIRQTIPGKPIKYVVPTHHHADHGAGLRAYIAEGARVLTTPGNAAFVKRLATAPFSWKPDLLARRPREPIIETLTDKRAVIRSGSHAIELYDIGPEPHAQENIAVWLPAERVLFLGDLFETSYRTQAAWDGKGILGDILARFKWDVETIVTSHSRPRRMADLRAGGTQ